jgi:hypothetical protein
MCVVFMIVPFVTATVAVAASVIVISVSNGGQRSRHRRHEQAKDGIRGNFARTLSKFAARGRIYHRVFLSL